MTTDIRRRVIEEAVKWLGTPWRHQCSARDKGADCLGLIRGVWRNIYDQEPEQPPPYTPDWAEALGEEILLEAARRHMIEIPTGQAAPGDMLLFRIKAGCPAKHAAIMSTPEQIIHAYWGRAVTETHLVPWWRRRLAAAFAFPPVAKAQEHG